ncbi:hypothetical protein [Lactobacillus sp. PSON]|uniref:hypothetical protein n=1 Tax=Lactobacillus sp. PSON TaxID=3455454 RepID=UPI00404355D8
MKLLAKLALAGSLILGSMTVIGTNINAVQTVHADQNAKLTSKQGKEAATMVWNPYARVYDGKRWETTKPYKSNCDIGYMTHLTSVVKSHNIFFAQLNNARSLLSNFNAPTIYTAKANIPVLAHSVDQMGIDENGAWWKNGKTYKTPIPAGYLSKGTTLALLTPKKKVTIKGVKYYMIHPNGEVATDKMDKVTDFGSSSVQYMKVSDFKKLKKGGKLPLGDGQYLTNKAYHMYRDCLTATHGRFYCPNRKVYVKSR